MTIVANPSPSTRANGPLAELVDCLEAEYGALLAEDYERLDAVLARKEQLLARLAALPGAPQGEHGRRALCQALEKLRNLNGRNARALVPRAAGNRARLHFLQAALGRGALYAADGSVQAGPQGHPARRSA